MKTKVLFVTPTFYPATIFGGPIMSTYELCNALVQLGGVNIDVITTDSNGFSRNEVLSNRQKLQSKDILYNIDYLPKLLGSEFSPTMLWKLFFYIKKAEVVHITYVYSLSTLISLFLCRIFRKPVVWSTRGACIYWQGSKKLFSKMLWNKFCSFLLHQSKTIIHVTSEREEQFTRKVFPDVKFCLIPNGVQIPNHVKATPKYTNNKPLSLLYLGRLHPIKGLENLFEALKILNDSEFQTIILRVYGAGDLKYEQHLNRRIGELGIEHIVSFFGHICDEEKSSVFRDSDITVVPSFTENFCLVAAESLSHATPVIASMGTPWQGLNSKGCGIWTSNDPPLLAEAIVEMSTQNLFEMGLKGRRWIKEDYNWRSIARKTNDIYRSLLLRK